MKKVTPLLVCAVLGSVPGLSAAGDPVLDAWVLSASTNPAVRVIAPEVHSVHVDAQFVSVESAGLSLHSFGALEANQYDPPMGPRTLTFRIPRNPQPAAMGAHLSTPLGIVGVFATGVPIYNPIGTASWHDQNIWHEDAVRATGKGPSPLVTALNSDASKHSPVIGFALDGYPIYGPFGWNADGDVQRMKSSYRLRVMSKRSTLPDGTLLTPGQEGPDVDRQYPLGTFAEDYEFVKGSGDLDEYNGRYAKSPDYPDGTYAYFLTTWPYLVGPRYFGALNVDAPARISVHHAMGNQAAGNQVDLWTDRKVIHAGEPVNLTLAFTDRQGHAIRFLEKVHRQPVHLIVVSKDLAEFSHIHPDPVAGDALSVVHTFAKGGEYTLYADYTAPGAAPAIARFDLTVEGDSRPTAPLYPDSTLTKTVDGVRIALATPAQLKAGEDLPLRFTLSDAHTGLPITDLEPWLGAWAHVMITSADRATFIHAHPLENAGTGETPLVHVHTAPIAGPSPSTISTITGFRTPGVYKLWFQFQRHGEVLTASWVVSVQGVAHTAPHVPTGHLTIKISSAGFEPSRLTIPSGQKTQAAFTRLDAQNCAGEIAFPELGIRKQLAPGQTVLIDLPATQKGEYHFACGMGMFRGALVVQ